SPLALGTPRGEFPISALFDFRPCRAPLNPYFLRSSLHLGSGVCATITLFLKSSTISGLRRISVGRFASVIWAILSCSFIKPKKSPSGRGGHPTIYTSTGTMRSTPCKAEQVLKGPPTHEHAPIDMHHFASGMRAQTRWI